MVRQKFWMSYWKFKILKFETLQTDICLKCHLLNFVNVCIMLPEWKNT